VSKYVLIITRQLASLLLPLVDHLKYDANHADTIQVNVPDCS